MVKLTAILKSITPVVLAGTVVGTGFGAEAKLGEDLPLGLAVFGTSESAETLLNSEFAQERRRGELPLSEFVRRAESLGYSAKSRDGYWVLIEESALQVNQLLVVAGILEKFFTQSQQGVRLADLNDAEFGYVAALTASTPELKNIVLDGNAVVSVGLVSNYQLSREGQSAWFSSVHMPSRRDIEIAPSQKRATTTQEPKQIERWDVRLVEEIAAKNQLAAFRAYTELVADYIEAKQEELDELVARVEGSANDTFAKRALEGGGVRMGSPLPDHVRKGLEGGSYIDHTSHLSSQERLQLLTGGVLSSGFLEVSLMVNPVTETGMPNHAFYVPGLRLRLKLSD